MSLNLTLIIFVIIAIILFCIVNMRINDKTRRRDLYEAYGIWIYCARPRNLDEGRLYWYFAVGKEKPTQVPRSSEPYRSKRTAIRKAKKYIIRYAINEEKRLNSYNKYTQNWIKEHGH